MAESKTVRRKAGQLTHLDRRGSARMVDVGAKSASRREAIASCRVEVGAEAMQLLMAGELPKGDALAVARIAGIAAAKRTAELLPLCHPLPIEAVELEVVPAPPDAVSIRAVVRITGKTGVEMEALTAAGVAALAVYDMVKAVARDAVIGPLRLEEKRGGKSGVYRRRGPKSSASK